MDWASAIPDMVGAFLAAVSAVVVVQIIEYLRRKRERKATIQKEYDELILVLRELRLFITRCEAYMGFELQGKAHFNKIVLQAQNLAFRSRKELQVKQQTISSILLLYSTAEVIRMNFERAEVRRTDSVHTDVKTGLSKTEAVEDSIITKGRYGVALAFIRHYLCDVYRHYNLVVKDAKNIADDYDFLNFPLDLDGFPSDYVIKQAMEWKLVPNGRLEGP